MRTPTHPSHTAYAMVWHALEGNTKALESIADQHLTLQAGCDTLLQIARITVPTLPGWWTAFTLDLPDRYRALEHLWPHSVSVVSSLMGYARHDDFEAVDQVLVQAFDLNSLGTHASKESAALMALSLVVAAEFSAAMITGAFNRQNGIEN